MPGYALPGVYSPGCTPPGVYSPGCTPQGVVCQVYTSGCGMPGLYLRVCIAQVIPSRVCIAQVIHSRVCYSRSVPPGVLFPLSTSGCCMPVYLRVLHARVPSGVEGASLCAPGCVGSAQRGEECVPGMVGGCAQRGACYTPRKQKGTPLCAHLLLQGYYMGGYPMSIRSFIPFYPERRSNSAQRDTPSVTPLGTMRRIVAVLTLIFPG